jgi:hypothetical protein
MTEQPPPPGDTSVAAFDLMFLRTRAAQRRLPDEDLTALTGIPTAHWAPTSPAHTLPAAALLALARALNTSPELLLRVPEHNLRGVVPGAATHATALHAALLEAGRIHPDELASALQWGPHSLNRAGKGCVRGPPCAGRVLCRPVRPDCGYAEAHAHRWPDNDLDLDWPRWRRAGGDGPERRHVPGTPPVACRAVHG